jgi:hypothetical protein
MATAFASLAHLVIVIGINWRHGTAACMIIKSNHGFSSTQERQLYFCDQGHERMCQHAHEQQQTLHQAALEQDTCAPQLGTKVLERFSIESHEVIESPNAVRIDMARTGGR